MALYNKPEYSKLNKNDAIKKLVDERMTKIGNDLKLKIDYYTYKKSILYIKYII